MRDGVISRKGPFKRMLITGMSGTGKSAWQLYFMWRLAQAGKSAAVFKQGHFFVVNRCALAPALMLGMLHSVALLHLAAAAVYLRTWLRVLPREHEHCMIGHLLSQAHTFIQVLALRTHCGVSGRGCWLSLPT